MLFYIRPIYLVPAESAESSMKLLSLFKIMHFVCSLLFFLESFIQLYFVLYVLSFEKALYFVLRILDPRISGGKKTIQVSDLNLSD